MSFHKLYEIVTPYIVRIETQEGYGTGFLFGYNGTKEMAAIATAAHVVDRAHEWKQPIRIKHYSTGGECFLPAEKRAILIDKEKDSASILIASNKLDLPEETLPLMDREKYRKIGTDLGWVGFPSVASNELCFFKGCVSAFALESDTYLIDGVAINGVSGGPVFGDKGDETPQIIGTVSAYSPNLINGKTLPGLLRAQDITPFHETNGAPPPRP